MTPMTASIPDVSIHIHTHVHAYVRAHGSAHVHAHVHTHVRLMKRCSHEGVCQVLDYLFLADDLRPRLCVIVLQLIPGMSLRTYLRSLPDHKMPVKDVVTMASQLLEVLEHIHSQGVIHRDISPANILISKERDWSYTVCDFGTSVVSPNVHDVTVCGDYPLSGASICHVP